MEADSVTLNTNVTTNQQDDIKWYFSGTLIAHISGDLSVICIDVQCNNKNGRFKDRVTLDHQTGSLTITNNTNTDTGEYKLLIIKTSDSETTFKVTVHDVSKRDQSVMEGESVTLDPGVINPNDSMTWYFSDTLIAEITGDKRQICTDDQCEERFRDRLKLDHQTGSLTIMNTTNTDSGVYHLQISSRRFSISVSFSVSVTGVFAVDIKRVTVSVMEEDLVTLCTSVTTNQQENIQWYFNDTYDKSYDNNTLIAHINGSLSVICTDVQCEDINEQFRDRLKLDHQTGSLTITNINSTDTGDYKLLIIKGTDRETIFSVTVHAAERDEGKRKSVMKGESVTLATGVTKNTNYLMKWYFNGVRITVITGDQCQIWTDDQRKERFRDRLKVDHQTGSLTITNTTTEDSGLYKLQINSYRFSIFRSFRVSVTDSGPAGTRDEL